MAASPSGRGYWLVASDGGTFAFGDARFFGSTGGFSLNQPIVGMAAAPSGRGYWLVASDGDKPVVSIAASPSGRGYWLVGADGSVVPFGHARFCGSMYGRRLGSPNVGVALQPPA